MTVPGERRRLAILRYLADYVAGNGFAPSLKEIGRAVGIAGSGSTVIRHLDELERRGRIRRDRRRPRAVHLLLTPGVATVPVRRCEACKQDMPADHVCRAFSADPYGSPSDIDAP